MQFIRPCFFLLLVVLTAGCTTYNLSKRVVQQGNLLTPKLIKRLKLGMSKPEVAILMGTSLISPLFNDNRWDYAYTRRTGATSNTTRHLSLYFAHDRLIKVEP